jgi:hypothetical protein
VYLGKRNVRSAGRTSGSVEITLPAKLHLLAGIDCQLVVRDGPRPEIVLQPDLTTAHTLFQEMWLRLRLGLSEIDDIGDFSTADYTLTLFAPSHWQEKPPLICADALAVLRGRGARDADYGEPLAGIVASLGIVAGRRLSLDGQLAAAFGDATAYLLTSHSAGLGTDFERGLARQIYLAAMRAPSDETGGGSAAGSAATALDRAAWQRAAPALRQVFDQFLAWQSQPDAYASAREKWYRALAAEAGMLTGRSTPQLDFQATERHVAAPLAIAPNPGVI